MRGLRGVVVPLGDKVHLPICPPPLHVCVCVFVWPRARCSGPGEFLRCSRGKVEMRVSICSKFLYDKKTSILRCVVLPSTSTIGFALFLRPRRKSWQAFPKLRFHQRCRNDWRRPPPIFYVEALAVRPEFAVISKQMVPPPAFPGRRRFRKKQRTQKRQGKPSPQENTRPQMMRCIGGLEYLCIKTRLKWKKNERWVKATRAYCIRLKKLRRASYVSTCVRAPLCARFQSALRQKNNCRPARPYTIVNLLPTSMIM